MPKDSLRKIGSFLLVSAMWSSSIVLPASIFAQTAPAAKSQTDKSKKSKKDNKKSDDTKTQTQSSSGLSTKEDPSQIGKRNINGGSDKFFGWLGGSKEKEAAIGRQLAMEVEQQVKLVDDPVITEYVNRVGQNIVLHSDAKVPFTIKVIDSDEVNAFALPGGYFYVNKGLLLAADNEAELAGVMAHEIAHVAARHAMENQGKAQAINYGMLAGIIFGGGIISSVLQNAGGILGGLGMLKFSRSAEEEADRLGVQYLYASGYDPTAMSTMFEKLSSLNKKKPGKVAKLFTSHPQPVDRRDSSLALVAKFPEREEYVMSTSEFQKVKSRLFKQSNARASTSYDVDDSTVPGRPTLKRRAPEVDDSTTPTSSPNSTSTDNSNSTPAKDGPPQLKRRGAPDPTPTPNH
ncbi:MAG: M48 family metallopeptidase [Pyrinomonadaceae bacterium]